MDASLVIRPGVEGDHNFIIQSWIRSWRISKPGKLIPQEIYSFEMSHLVMSTLARSSCDVVAAAAEPSTIVAWIVYDQRPRLGVVHFAYTRPQARKRGVCRELVARVGAEGRQLLYTHHTDAGGQVAQRLGCTYDPFTGYRSCYGKAA